MTIRRKNFETREKDLRLAIFRIENGRSQTKATKLNISAVAREAGVTPALIHNHYPAIAEKIRTKQGASSRRRCERKLEELKREREKNKSLRGDVAELRAQIAELASINETLLQENRDLKANFGRFKVINLGADA